MRLTVVLQTYAHQGGSTVHFVNHAVEMRRRVTGNGIRVYAACRPGEKDASGLMDNLRQVFAPDELLLLENEDVALVEAVRRLLLERPPVVVHIRSTRLLKSLIPLRKEYPDRLRIVYEVYSFRNTTWMRRPFSWALSHAMRRHVDYTIFLAPFAADQFVGSGKVMRCGRGGILPPAIHDIPEAAGQRPAPGQIDEGLMELLQKPDAFRFVYLAQFNPGKGHEWLLEGIAPALRRHREAHAILIGGGSAESLAAVRGLSARLDVASQIVLPGRIHRNFIPWILTRCHAGLFASVSETFGYTIIEPMAAGLPIVGTRKGVAEWLIMDYRTGIGVEYGDRLGMQRGVEYVLDHPDVTAEMGRNAAALVRPLFTWDHMVASHLRVYSSTLSRGR